MDRIKLIKSDTYWISKINTLLYHKNYRGIERRKVLVNEILIIKNELIRAMAEKEQESTEALHKHDVSNNEVGVCPECGCNKTTIVDDETWCLNKLCGAEWQTDC